MKALNRVMGMVVIMNIITPSFTDFFYPYEFIVLGLTQLQISNLYIFSLFVSFVFLVIYNGCLTKVEFRWAILVVIFASVLGNLTALLLIKEIV